MKINSLLLSPRRVAGAAVRRARSAGLFPGRLSYAQFGEDIIAASIFWYLGIPKPSYLDIGAFAPAALSNTFYFYKRGCSGVCVEPNPAHLRRFRQARRRDICLNAGAGSTDQASVPFYALSDSALSVFDEAVARQHVAKGTARIERVVSVPIYSLNTLIEKHCRRCPDFLSLDVEGLDLAILQAMDFTRYRPAVICVETIDFYSQRKDQAIITFMESQGYQVQADTVINTIFVEETAWTARAS